MSRKKLSLDGQCRVSLVEMASLPASSEHPVEGEEDAEFPRTARTVGLAQKWTKGFRRLSVFPGRGGGGVGGGPGGLGGGRSRYEPSVASEDSKSTRRKNTMFVIPTDNTYKMEPDIRFKPDAVERVIRAILEEDLQHVQYSARDSPHVSKALSVKIRRAVKELGFPRYRIVSHVSIGQKRGQSFQSVSRCLWDERNDDFATASYRNESIFATATVWGIYYE